MSRLIPIYPLTAKLYSWDLQKVIATALDLVTGVPDVLHARAARAVRASSTVMPGAALDPRPRRLEPGRCRPEALPLRGGAGAPARARPAARGAPGRWVRRARAGRDDGLLAAFDARLPFELTGGQREIGDLVADELARDHPMNRLLQGEVGSGKTLVALRAMLQVVDAGGQAALLAPTEVLAQQHHRSITAMLGDLAQGGMLGGAADGHPGRAAHRLDGPGGPAGGDARASSPARPAS